MLRDKFDTLLPADCVDVCQSLCFQLHSVAFTVISQFCPAQDDMNVLFCGTYYLNEEESSNRVGWWYMMDTSCSPNGDLELNPFYKRKGSGLFESKWSHVDEDRTLALALADGSLCTLRLGNEEGKYIVNISSTYEISRDSMCLSVDWNNRTSPSGSTQLVCSLSDGNVAVIDVDQGTVLHKWKAHDFEAWASSFDGNDQNIVYSGADDCLFKIWDIRASTSRPSSVIKQHEAGVCCISPSPFHKEIVATGSYDEYIRVWDNRKFSSPVASFCTGGGVWRMKWDRTTPSSIIAACMHNGVHVVRMKGEGVLEEVLHYSGHESLAYGVDWIPDSGNQNLRKVASCSFYDHSLHVWFVEL